MVFSCLLNKMHTPWHDISILHNTSSTVLSSYLSFSSPNPHQISYMSLQNELKILASMSSSYGSIKWSDLSMGRSPYENHSDLSVCVQLHLLQPAKSRFMKLWLVVPEDLYEHLLYFLILLCLKAVVKVSVSFPSP